VHSSGHVDFLAVNPEDVDSLLVDFVRRPYRNLRHTLRLLLLLGLKYSVMVLLILLQL